MTPDGNVPRDPSSPISDDEVALLTAYALGELEGPELEHAQRLIAQQSAGARFATGVRMVQAAGALPRRDPEPALVALLQTLDLSSSTTSAFPPSLAPRSSHARRTGVGIVAATIAVTIAAVALGTAILRESRDVRMATNVVGGTVYTTHAGQRATLTLADGVRVILAPRTRLVIATTAAARTFTLDGEAYFTVASVSTHPVIIHVGEVAVRVLGTSFDVRHYGTDPNVRVTVTEGKVNAEGRRGRVTMTRGMIAYVNDSTILTRTSADASTPPGWTKGQLTFRDVPVATVLADIGSWYGYQFRVLDSTLVAQRITTVLAVDHPAHALTMLEDLLDVTMTLDGNVVTVRPHHRTATPSAPVRQGTERRYSTPLEVGK